MKLIPLAPPFLNFVRCTIGYIGQFNSCTIGQPYPHPIEVETTEWEYTADEIMVSIGHTPLT